jgi:L,D-transpeptidase catalytic domain
MRPRAKAGRRLAAASAALLAAVVPPAAAASSRASFPLIAGAAAVHHPPAAIAAPSRSRGATLAGVIVGVEARSRPGAGSDVSWVGTATSWSAEPQVLLVLDSAKHRGREWLRVLLPIRPDGSSGWIPRDNVVLLSTPYWITVDNTARTVTIYRNGKLLYTFGAVIGKPTTPTPDGLAAIYERDPQPDPHGFLGPWALPLTIFSNVLFNSAAARAGSRSTDATAPASTTRSAPPARTVASGSTTARSTGWPATSRKAPQSKLQAEPARAGSPHPPRPARLGAQQRRSDRAPLARLPDRSARAAADDRIRAEAAEQDRAVPFQH